MWLSCSEISTNNCITIRYTPPCQQDSQIGSVKIQHQYRDEQEWGGQVGGRLQSHIKDTLEGQVTHCPWTSIAKCLNHGTALVETIQFQQRRTTTQKIRMTTQMIRDTTSTTST